MPVNSLQAVWNRETLRALWWSGRQDLLWIVGLALVLGAVLAAFGKATTTTTSTAQVILTPMPLRVAAEGPDATPQGLAKMLARPLDMKTATMLCQSDQVLENTRKAVKENPEYDGEFKTLSQLKNALTFSITVSKDTPYDTVYSPILELTAQADSPKNARILANTWAEECVKAAAKFQEASQRPAMEAFGTQVDRARAELEKAEQAYEEFKKAYNPVYLTARLQGYADLMQSVDLSRTLAEQQAFGAEAKAKALEQSSTQETPTVVLDWQATNDLIAAITGRAPRGGEGEPGPVGSLQIEQVNQPSVEIRTQLAMQQGESASQRAQLARLAELVRQYQKEIDETQSLLGQAEILDKRLAREVEVKEIMYREAAINQEYARLAASLDYEQMQLLSPGGEWAMPRFRRAILLGFAGVVFGLLMGVFASATMRLYVLPALKAEGEGEGVALGDAPAK